MQAVNKTAVTRLVHFTVNVGTASNWLTMARDVLMLMNVSREMVVVNTAVKTHMAGFIVHAQHILDFTPTARHV